METQAAVRALYRPRRTQNRELFIYRRFAFSLACRQEVVNRGGNRIVVERIGDRDAVDQY